MQEPPIRIDELRRIERQRARERRQRRRRLAAALVLFGAVLSVLGLYITLPARLAESVNHYRFELVRPALGPFLRVSVAAVLSGGLLAWLLAWLASAGSRRRHTPLAWGFYGILFGLLIPFATGAFIPATGTLIDVFIRAAPWRGFGERLFYSVFGTPLFATVYGILGFYIGLISGVFMAVGGWLMDHANGSENPRVARFGPMAFAAVLSAVIAVPILFGPFSLFKSLVTMWGA